MATAGKGVIRSGGGGSGASGGGVDIGGDEVWSMSSRVGEGSGGEEGCKGGSEPGLEEKQKEESRERHSSTFFHSDWRVKGIIPSTLHPPMLRSLVTLLSHTGLKHFMKCSYPKALKILL